MGQRVSEVVALKVSDIDSARMMIRIEQSKRRKDRYAIWRVVMQLLGCAKPCKETSRMESASFRMQSRSESRRVIEMPLIGIAAF